MILTLSKKPCVRPALVKLPGTASPLDLNVLGDSCGITEEWLKASCIVIYQANLSAARIKASRGIHHLRHSRHVLFALKFGGGISLLSLPAFLPPGSAGRQWYDSTRGAWTVISYMYVLEVTTGATFRVGVFRTIGTFVGALAAFICALIAKKNPYGLVVLATTCSVPIHYGMLFSRRAPIALVA